MAWKRASLLANWLFQDLSHEVSEAKCPIRESDTCLEDGKREGSNAIFSVKYYDIKPFVMGEGGGGDVSSKDIWISLSYL